MTEGKSIRGMLGLLLTAATLPAFGQNEAPVLWPQEQWETATPGQVGMDSSLLTKARDCALTGGGSGMITRHGKVVLRWGDQKQTYDLKSSSKGKWPGAPYPASEFIEKVEWAPAATIARQAEGSDNWPITWADDGNLYTAYGDGQGFTPKVNRKLSLGFAKIVGGPENYQGINIRSRTGETVGEGAAGPKASGMLCVNGVLYMLVRNTGNSQVAWSEDHAATWNRCDWKFETSFGAPTFLNFGADYAGRRDDFVYLYAADSDSAYTPADRMVMARVPLDRIRERTAYEFFQGLEAAGQPAWTKDIRRRGAVFVHPGRCYRSGISYNAGLKRYLWCQILPFSTDSRGPRFQGGFGIYEAPEPWGPWRTVFYTENWDVGPGETSSFPTKWMSRDGRTCHLVFSGADCFSVRRVELTVPNE